MKIFQSFQRKKTIESNPLIVSEPKVVNTNAHQKRLISFSLAKRQKFVIATLFLAITFFFLQFKVGQQDLFIIIGLALLTDIFLYWAMRKDLKENMMYTIFILPFFFTLAFGLFNLLIPTRILYRLILTILYGFGLYSLFLSQNIFVVGASRTIALLAGARIVSFVITLLCIVFLTNTVLSIHLPIYLTVLGLLPFIWALAYHSLWTYTLQKTPYRLSLWSGGITLCMLEIASVLLFWTSTPTVIALFLTSIFYVFTGLSHIWIERRLFKNVLWEYAWVVVIAFVFILFFTTWGR